MDEKDSVRKSSLQNMRAAKFDRVRLFAGDKFDHSSATSSVCLRTEVAMFAVGDLTTKTTTTTMDSIQHDEGDRVRASAFKWAPSLSCAVFGPQQLYVGAIVVLEADTLRLRDRWC